jgi:FlaG/FlaF family flagellin (archaellin)
MSRLQKNESAVSPVIGVMLMIVVTIIIAAVVAAFSGGLSSDQKKTPNAVFVVAGVSTSGNGTVTFQQTGGDELALNEIIIQLQYNGQAITLSNADKMRGHSDLNYLTEVGGSSDGYITASDRFILTADTNSNSQFSYRPDGAAAAFTLPYNAHISYMILDKTSGKAIQNGEFVLRNS